MLLSRTVLGRHIYALGGNEQAARLSGIRTDNGQMVRLLLQRRHRLDRRHVLRGRPKRRLARQPGRRLRAERHRRRGGRRLQPARRRRHRCRASILGVVFLRVVIDAVAKLIKAGADIYEGMIVGIVVVIAVTFSQLRQIRASGRELFPGAAGR